MRELENLVKRIVVLESEELVTQELAAREAGFAAARAAWPPTRAPPAPVLRARREVLCPGRRRRGCPASGSRRSARHAAREAEHDVIQQVLEEVRWNRMEAARRLKISYKALLYKIRMYELASAKPVGKKLP